MTRNPDVLERLAPLSGAPSRGFEDLLRLRAKRQVARKIGAIAVVTVLVVALAAVGLEEMRDRTGRPASPPHESQPGTFTGMVIRYTGNYNNEVPGDLVARDPSTGKAITLVDDAKVPDFNGRLVAWAAASADGRWVAFESPFCQGNLPEGITEEKSGLWVTNGTDEPRQLTAPCAGGSEPSDDWAWSPTGSRLATVEGDHLILVDPATGDRTDLGQAAGPLAWSPDGTQIAYAAAPAGSPDGNSPDGVYVVSVNGGEHALIAGSLGGEVPGGEEGSGLVWSPDGTRIAVLAGAGGAEARLYIMNADGSDRRPLAKDVLVAHTLGSPNIAWSPDGMRIAYATSNRGSLSGELSGARDLTPIWSASADGSTRVLVFNPTSDPPDDTEVGGPIWSPDGTKIAFRYDSHSLQRSYLIANADGTGNAHEIDELRYRSWRGGWYFCECYG
jgi:Tol biopolymer transport system component